MLSTIPTIDKDEDFVENERRRPRDTSTDANFTRGIFGEEATITLKIPRIVDDYNHNMNGVDIADQLRSNYSTQRTHL
jgi:hypothetical protein